MLNHPVLGKWESKKGKAGGNPVETSANCWAITCQVAYCGAEQMPKGYCDSWNLWAKVTQKDGRCRKKV